MESKNKVKIGLTSQAATKPVARLYSERVSGHILSLSYGAELNTIGI